MGCFEAFRAARARGGPLALWSDRLFCCHRTRASARGGGGCAGGAGGRCHRTRASSLGEGGWAGGVIGGQAAVSVDGKAGWEGRVCVGGQLLLARPLGRVAGIVLFLLVEYIVCGTERAPMGERGRGMPYTQRTAPRKNMRPGAAGAAGPRRGAAGWPRHAGQPLHGCHPMRSRDPNQSEFKNLGLIGLAHPMAKCPSDCLIGWHREASSGNDRKSQSDGVCPRTRRCWRAILAFRPPRPRSHLRGHIVAGPRLPAAQCTSLLDPPRARF